MLPAEKAKELLAKMNVLYHMKLGSGKTLPISMRDEQIKQCAINAVDEILNFDLKAKNESQFIIERRIEEYWQEVKTELEKL